LEASLRPDETTYTAAKVFFLDTIGVGISGSHAYGADAIFKVADSWGDGNAVSILGRNEKLPASAAAFVNGFQIHCQEFDAVHEQAVVHAMSVCTASMLSEVSSGSISGKDFLRALILGVDLACNLGIACRSGLQFFRPATAGAFGAVLAVATLRGFSESRLQSAWGHVYAQIPGTMQAHVEGAITLPMQIGYAARAAINAVDFAETELSSPLQVFDGTFGYFSLLEKDWDQDHFANTLTENARTAKWHIKDLSHKPFPTGRAAHAILDGIQQLRAQHDFKLDDCERVVATVPELIFRLVARKMQPDMSISYARLFLQYHIPNLLLDGTLTTDSYGEERMRSKNILAAAQRIEIEQDNNPDPNAMSPQKLAVYLKTGRCLEIVIPHTLGSPINPLTEDQYLDKFTSCCAEGQVPVTGERLTRLHDSIMRLEACRDMQEISNLCSGALQ